ncbi:MAG: GDP-L-fucose synthase family protein [Candidatus Methylacidiphilales bacterium]
MKKIFIAGHRGLVGSALTRLYSSTEGWEILVRTRAELDLTDERSTLDFLRSEKPDVVIDAAAKVGGIHANNQFPVDFLLHNLKIQNSLIAGAHQAGVEKLLFLGSSCIYPKFARQPITEDQLMTGSLEPTNDAYAIAKIAGIQLCRAYRKQYGSRFISAMPTNLYGPNDNFDLETSHVLPALIHKFHLAQKQKKNEVVLWGTGTPRREFLHVDDLASACHLLVENYDSPEIINIGTGEDVTIKELAEAVGRVVGFEGQITWDDSKPDGTPRKLLDVTRLKSLGWQPRIPLEEGIRSAYQWFLDHHPAA